MGAVVTGGFGLWIYKNIFHRAQIAVSSGIWHQHYCEVSYDAHKKQ